MAIPLDAPDLPSIESWQINPSWTLFIQSDMLFLSGGADEIYAVDEAASPACAQLIFSAWQQSKLDTLRHQPECQPALRQLRRIGAIVSNQALAAAQTLALVWLGEPNPGLLAALQQLTAHAAGPKLIADRAAADTLLLIRTTANWETTISTYQAFGLRQPHLWVDLAYHHTAVIGPYVVPQETACIHCLANRVAHRWGDAPLPELPQVQEQTALLAALIYSIFNQSPKPQWVNWMERNLSFDLNTLQTQSAHIYRLPWCPVCHPGVEAPLAAPLSLPW